MEIKKLAEMIAKRVYPETEKEKKCINEFGKMIINRGRLTKKIIQLADDSTREKNILEQGEEQSDTVHKEIPY